MTNEGKDGVEFSISGSGGIVFVPLPEGGDEIVQDTADWGGSMTITKPDNQFTQNRAAAKQVIMTSVRLKVISMPHNICSKQPCSLTRGRRSRYFPKDAAPVRELWMSSQVVLLAEIALHTDAGLSYPKILPSLNFNEHYCLVPVTFDFLQPLCLQAVLYSCTLSIMPPILS